VVERRCRRPEVANTSRPTVTGMPEGQVVLLVGVLIATPWLLTLGVTGLRRPVLLLAAYAAIIPFGSGISVPVPFPPPFHTVSTLLGLAASGVLAASLIATSQRARIVSRAVPLWLLFLAYLTLSILWSIDAAETSANILILVSLVGLYVLVTLTQWRPRDLRLLEHGLALSGAATGIYALVLQLTGRMHLTGAGWPRLQTAGGGGEGGDPNITAATLLLPFIVTVARGIDRRQPPLTRIAYLLAAALTGIAVMLTGSRGGLLGLTVAFVALSLNERRPSTRVLLILIPVGIMLTAFLLSPGFIQSRIQNEHSSGRTDIWRTGLDGCPEVCLVGSGWATFSDVYGEQALTQPDARLDRLSIRPHSLWVRIVVEGGIPGTLLLLAVLFVTIRELLRLPAVVRGPPLGAVVGLLVTQTFLGNVDFKYFWLVLIYTAMVVQLHHPVSASRTAVAAPPLSRA
jgi:O-antigen ligase